MTSQLPQLVPEKRLDAVAQRLRGIENHEVAVLRWLEHQQQRKSMRRRALVCTIAGWLLVLAAATTSSLVSVRLSHDAQEIFGGVLKSSGGVPASVTYLPIALVVLTVCLVIAGVACWAAECVPGFSSTTTAIDWSAASEAMTQLLSGGVPYPEACRAAAEVAPSKASRTWLSEAALRVERGGPEVPLQSVSRGDAAVLESLVGVPTQEPHRQWQVAAEHFLDVARNRLVLLLQSMPIVSTIIAGLLIWIAIASTLGWMWRAVADLISGLA